MIILFSFSSSSSIFFFSPSSSSLSSSPFSFFSSLCFEESNVFPFFSFFLPSSLHLYLLMPLTSFTYFFFWCVFRRFFVSISLPLCFYLLIPHHPFTSSSSSFFSSFYSSTLFTIFIYFIYLSPSLFHFFFLSPSIPLFSALKIFFLFFFSPSSLFTPPPPLFINFFFLFFFFGFFPHSVALHLLISPAFQLPFLLPFVFLPLLLSLRRLLLLHFSLYCISKIERFQRQTNDQNKMAEVPRVRKTRIIK